MEGLRDQRGRSRKIREGYVGLKDTRRRGSEGVREGKGREKSGKVILRLRGKEEKEDR